MNSFNQTEFQPNPLTDHEANARDQVLKIGEQLISAVAERGGFAFNNAWQARPLASEDGLTATGAVFEEDDLKNDWLNRVELSRAEGNSLDIHWTTVRPNANDRTTYQETSNVAPEVSRHYLTAAWSYDLPGGIGVSDIYGLQNRLAQLQAMTNLPPKLPRQNFWHRLFGKVAGAA